MAHQGYVTSRWDRLVIERPRTRVEKSKFPVQMAPAPLPAPRLVRYRQSAAALGEVIPTVARCPVCGRKRGELIRTLNQFTCKRCVDNES